MEEKKPVVPGKYEFELRKKLKLYLLDFSDYQESNAR